MLPVPFIQSTHKRWGRHYTKRYCLLKGRGKNVFISKLQVWYYHPTSKCLIPSVRNCDVLLKFTSFFYEMMQLYTKQCSLYPTRVLAWHFMPMNKTVVQYKKNPTGHFLLTYKLYLVYDYAVMWYNKFIMQSEYGNGIVHTYHVSYYKGMLEVWATIGIWQ